MATRSTVFFVLAGACALTGCADLFLSSEERAARAAGLASISRIGVLGASLSAGFGTGRSLADVIDAAVRARHVTVDAADPLAFSNPRSAAETALARLEEKKPSVVVALDFLFWFAYGQKGSEQRSADVQAALQMLERLGCSVFVGDLPDMAGASPKMLPAASIPSPEELSRLNREIETWARVHEGVRVLPLGRWMSCLRQAEPIAFPGGPAVLRKEEVLQDDDLHPTEKGQMDLAVLCLAAVKEAFAGLRPDDFILDPAKLGREVESLPCALSIEVVDESGALQRDGELRFDFDLFGLAGKSTRELMAMMAYRRLLEPQPLSGHNPLELTGFSADALTGKFFVHAEVPGLVPSDRAPFKLTPGSTTRVRLLVTRPRSLEIEVRDAATQAGVVGARVFSISELAARRIDASDAADSVVSTAGAATTAAEGRCVLRGLRPGPHNLEVHADGYGTAVVRGAAIEPDRRLTIPIERVRDPAMARVVVRSADGQPAARWEVLLGESEVAAKRVGLTDDSGVATFAGLRAKQHLVEIALAGLRGELRAHRETPGHAHPLVIQRYFTPAPAGETTLELGWIRGPAALETRVADIRGRPLSGISVSVYGPGRGASLDSVLEESWILLAAETDSGGRAIFHDLPPGTYRVSVPGQTTRTEITVGPSAGAIVVEVRVSGEKP